MVPPRRILALGWTGVFGGFYLAVLLLLFMQNVRGFWFFKAVDVYYVYRIPFFLCLAWMPIVIVFGHLLIQSRTPLQKWGILLLFPAGAALIHYLLIQNGMLIYRHWNLFGTFLVSWAIHAAIFGYLSIKRNAGQIL